MILSLEKDLSADTDVKGTVSAILTSLDKFGKHSHSLSNEQYRSNNDGFRSSCTAFSMISLRRFEEQINCNSSPSASESTSWANQSAACFTCVKEWVHAVGTRLIKQYLLKNKKKPYIHLFD